ncbi:MAG: hypothetical protein LBJ69_03095 [Holosporales bacterium]|jgi:hypothetical protein|nr:hypothetical protein [Holosporales bacterium]
MRQSYARRKDQKHQLNTDPASAPTNEKEIPVSSSRAPALGYPPMVIHQVHARANAPQPPQPTNTGPRPQANRAPPAQPRRPVAELAHVVSADQGWLASAEAQNADATGALFKAVRRIPPAVARTADIRLGHIIMDIRRANPQGQQNRSVADSTARAS